MIRDEDSVSAAKPDLAFSALAKTFRRLAVVDMALFWLNWILAALWGYIGATAPARTGQWYWMLLSTTLVAGIGFLQVHNLRHRSRMLLRADECELLASSAQMLADYGRLQTAPRSAFKVVK